MDITSQYPPELFDLLADAIQFLCNSEQDVLPFFQRAGVGYELLRDLWLRVEQSDDLIQKDEIVRTTLTRLNEKGATTLVQRKKILKQVTKFDDFSHCRPDEQLKAQDLVSEIRRVLDIKDSFSKVRLELEREHRKQQEEHAARLEAIKKKRITLEIIKDELQELFEMPDEQSEKCGILSETILNRLFKASDIPIKEAFKFVNDEEKEIKEQIEGLVEIDGYQYSVEMKWCRSPLSKAEVATHLVNVFNRTHAGGILIASSGYTNPALETCQEALSQKIIVLCELEEILSLLENGESFIELLQSKIRAAVIEKSPLFKQPETVRSDTKPEARELLDEATVDDIHEKVAEHYKIIDNIETSVSSTVHRPPLTPQKTYQPPVKEKQAPIDKEIHNKTTNKKNAALTTPSRRAPLNRKKTGKGPSQEEQILVGKEEILDQYVVELKKRSRGRAVMKLRRLLDLQRAYSQEPFTAAIKQAYKYGLYDLARLEKIILDNIAGGDFFDLS